ncbi:MAG TPA: hypothetical protein VNW99_06725 [Cytophagaceae bacterium]|jgi:hypothetical protein|nr:hypothetical protein [Cytophagaceae bacterium]
MNQPLYNPENIEAYITNKMSAADKASFQNELAKDPLLNNEIDLQKDIIESLKEHRKAQLKNRLNNIDVTTTTNYTGLKVAASILLAGLISFAGYNYLNNNKKNNQNIPVTNNTVISPEKTVITNNSKPEVITEKEKTNNTTNNIDIKGTVITSNQSSNSTIITRTTRTITQTTVESVNPAFNTPDVKDRHEEGDGIKSDNNISMPKGDVGNNNDESSLDNLKIEKIKDKKHNLFYQYYNNKLFLYGDFDSKPYEILELNTLKDKQLYLYFEDKYYGLKQNQIDITALELISNKETLHKLNEIRNK